MTAPAPKLTYVLDANAFIDARRRWYPFSVFRGAYWAVLEWHMKNGIVCSIDRVRSELLDEELKEWIAETELPRFFCSTDTPEVIQCYTSTVHWVANGGHYLPVARDGFLTNADGWLVAYAMAHGLTVVTQEESEPQRRNKVKIPDVCNQLGVPWINCFELLARLGVVFTWTPPGIYMQKPEQPPVVQEELFL